MSMLHVKKRDKILIVIVIIVIISIITINIIYRTPQKLAELCVLSDIETGDLIISNGHSLKSDIVKLLNGNSSNNSEYSHIGIFIKRDNTVNIVHMSVDKGYIATESLEEYIKNNAVVSYDIFKKKTNIPNPDILYKIIDSLRFINKPFDDTFEMSTEDKYYCTEFVYKSFINAGITDIKKITFDKYLYPKDFAQSDLFYKIDLVH